MTLQAKSLQAISLQAISLRAGFVAAVLLATPAAALAVPGMITGAVNLRAGPSAEFPVVNRLPSGVPVEVHGCIRQALWCDVSWGRERGWVAAQFLDYLYDGRYVALPSYLDVVDVPVASFVLTSYWSSYYFGRPWYRRHAWWNRHWTTQTRVASQTPAAQPLVAPAQAGHGMTPAGTVNPPAGSAKPPAGSAMPPAGSAMPPAGSAMTPAGVAVGRGANVAPAVVSGKAMGAQAMQPPSGRLAPAAGARDRFSGMRPAMTARASGPATAMRGGVMPMAAHAQVGGSRDNGSRRRH